jgi:hypothetical protein
VIERLIENWLARANERSFQVPFCHSLVREGYTILHLTRHNEMEMGKDVLALAPDGTPWAYQLKGADGGKITLSKWRSELSPQIVPLTMTRIVHPSIRKPSQHRSCVVVNGEFDEPVLHEIDAYNQACERDNRPHHRIETIVKGELEAKFRALGSDFWPPQITDIKALLELYVDSGKGPLPKAKLASVLEAILPIRASSKPSNDQCSRAIASAAVTTSLALSSFSSSDNYVAEFEGWTLYLAHLLALAERWELPKRSWEAEAKIALAAMEDRLARLSDELKDRQDYVQGNSLVDKPMYRVRMTHLVGLLSAYGLWLLDNGRETDEHYAFVRDFYLKHNSEMGLWGECAVPQFLAAYFFAGSVDPTPHRDRILHALLTGITQANDPRGKGFLAPPYMSAEEIMPHVFGVASKPLDDSFAGEAYSIEPLFHLYVRTNFKQAAKNLWPKISRIIHRSFVPRHKWEYYLWQNERGTNLSVLPNPTQCWDALKTIAWESEGRDIPKLIKNWPMAYLCFLMVVPHRLNASGVRWLATAIEQSS